MVLSAFDKGDSAVTHGKSSPQGQEVKEVYITHATVGKVIDTGMKDANQMGAAMAPAAVDTIIRHLSDTGREPGYYDLIMTGDLGLIGKEIALDLLSGAGIEIAASLRTAAHRCMTGPGHPQRRQRLRLFRVHLLRLCISGNAARENQKRIADLNRRIIVDNQLPAGRVDSGNCSCGCCNNRRRQVMDYLYAFLIGGGFCVVGQLLFDATKLTMPRILVLFVVAGAV
jgi:hypothetical protein